MTISTGSFILLLCSLITGLVVEAIKKMANKEIKNINLLVAIVSVVIGIIIPVGYMLLNKISFSVDSILYIVGIVGLSWLTAMLGYDKVIQTLMQVKK